MWAAGLGLTPPGRGDVAREEEEVDGGTETSLGREAVMGDGDLVLVAADAEEDAGAAGLMIGGGPPASAGRGGGARWGGAEAEDDDEAVVGEGWIT